tara:strand:+ start:708 stop:893 length:186 start_codon:yes stop_codon:yes gene_type:complete
MKPRFVKKNTNVALTARQWEELRRRREETGESVASQIRRALDKDLFPETGMVVTAKGDGDE